MRHRFFALFFAILFLVTSSSLAIAFIVANSESSSSSNSCSTSTAGSKLCGFTPTSNVPSLQIKDLKVGTGQVVKPGDNITVDYTGAVASTGIIFQSSLAAGKPVSFDLSDVIPGWVEGIPGMKVGGERELLIPSALGYGANPPANSGIPPNANLVFDVTLHSINK